MSLEPVVGLTLVKTVSESKVGSETIKAIAKKATKEIFGKKAAKKILKHPLKHAPKKTVKLVSHSLKKVGLVYPITTVLIIGCCIIIIVLVKKKFDKMGKISKLNKLKMMKYKNEYILQKKKTNLNSINDVLMNINSQINSSLSDYLWIKKRNGFIKAKKDLCAYIDKLNKSIKYIDQQIKTISL